MKQPAVCIGACAVLAHFKLKWLSSYSPIIISLNVCIAYRTSVDIGRFAASCSPEAEWLTPLVLASLYTAASLASQPATRPAVQWWHDHGQCLSCLFETPSFLHIYVDSINLMKHERRNENDVVNKKTVNRTKAYPNYQFSLWSPKNQDQHSSHHGVSKTFFFNTL